MNHHENLPSGRKDLDADSTNEPSKRTAPVGLNPVTRM
jgi:hypothetical protein